MEIWKKEIIHSQKLAKYGTTQLQEMIQQKRFVIGGASECTGYKRKYFSTADYRTIQFCNDMVCGNIDRLKDILMNTVSLNNLINHPESKNPNVFEYCGEWFSNKIYCMCFFWSGNIPWIYICKYDDPQYFRRFFAPKINNKYFNKKIKYDSATYRAPDPKYYGYAQIAARTKESIKEDDFLLNGIDIKSTDKHVTQKMLSSMNEEQIKELLTNVIDYKNYVERPHKSFTDNVNVYHDDETQLNCYISYLNVGIKVISLAK